MGLFRLECAAISDSNTPLVSTIASADEASQDFTFSHRGREFVLRVEPGRRIALLFNGVERKQRLYAGREPLYVWTNVELEWEEHHYIEARYWPSTGELRATVNGDPLASWQLPASAAAS